MSTELLDAIKRQSEVLSAEEMQTLGRYLLERAKSGDAELRQIDEGDAAEILSVRRRQTEWLKAHRDEYAGEYVALDGDVLVGHGPTIGKAREAAQQNGVSEPLLVRVFSEETIVSAGL